MKKKETRIRRSKRTRSRIRLLGMNRLSVHKTPRNIYAQIFSTDNSTVVTSASTLDKEIKGKIKNGGNVEAATEVGKRSGFKYHGRIKALADAARENGMEF